MDTQTDALISLISPLGHVPEDKFRRVVGMLEAMRHKPEIQAALDGMRSRIAVVRPPRQRTVQRILYLPVEDALINAPDKDGSGYVSRQVMAAAWSYLEKHTDPAQIAAWQEQINKFSGDTPEDEHALEDTIWSWAADLLRVAVGKAQLERVERKALLGDAHDLLGEMRQCLRFLDVGPQIRIIRTILPLKPLRSLPKDSRGPIRHLILDLQPPQQDQIYAILLGVMLRLAVPGEFLEDVPAIISGLPAAMKAELQARLTVFVMGDMDRRAVTALRSLDRDLNLRARKVELLVAALNAGDKAIMTGDWDTRKQLTSVRGTAERLVGEIVREAAGQIKSGIDLGSAADLPTLKNAEDGVCALRQCSFFADKIGLEDSVRGTLCGITAAIRERAASALEALRDGNESLAGEEARYDEVFWTIRMLELAGNIDEADTIRRTAMPFLLLGSGAAAVP